MSPILGFVPPSTQVDRDVISLDSEMVEVAMLLPRWQLAALESAAQRQGLSAGQMLRRLIGTSVAAGAPEAV